MLGLDFFCRAEDNDLAEPFGSAEMDAVHAQTHGKLPLTDDDDILQIVGSQS